MMGAVKVHLGVAKLASEYECTNPFIFKDMAFFMNFSIFFSKFLDIKINRT